MRDRRICRRIASHLDGLERKMRGFDCGKSMSTFARAPVHVEPSKPAMNGRSAFRQGIVSNGEARMCGIAGWLSSGRAIDPVVIQTMTDALAHRGPDSSDIWVESEIGLGHRRLAVIDTRELANQPMHDVDGDIVLVFNGEIYNFRELRAELKGLGHRFRTRSDSEVILESYKRYGTRCVERFNGMFAFAIWNRRSRDLFLARDRAGEKPLFYAETPSGLMFASESRALRSQLGGRQVDTASLSQYLAMGYVPGDRTLDTAIRKLPPGCTLIQSRAGKPVVSRYWSLAPHFSRNHGFATEDEAAEALRELIDDATRLRMVSDVPLGAFLSSGLDSATIVASMTRQAGDILTFSIGFDQRGYDEAADARATADVLGSFHADQTLGIDAPDMIAAIVRAAHEPIADNSVVPTWLLSRFAREHVTVALSGDGGDELFGGYDTYLADRLAKPLTAIPQPVWTVAAAAADLILPVSFDKVSLDYKARHFLRGLAQGWPRAHYSWRTIFGEAERRALLRPELSALCDDLDPYRDFAAAYEAIPAAQFLDRAMYVDMCTWMADDILVKVDRMSMSHALEVRAPFLDHRVMELAASLPSHWKIRGRRTKHILRESQRSRLPRAVLSRKKLGFNAPMSHWLLGPLREFAKDSLASPLLDNLFDRREIGRLWDEHESRKRDNGFKIFALVTLSSWLGSG